MHWTHNLDPAIFHLGSLEIRWYGLMYVISMISAYLFMKHYFIKKGTLRLQAKRLDDLITWIFFGLLIGARVFYILFYNISHYLSNPLEIFAFWHGGLSFHGGALGVAIATIMYTKRIKAPTLNVGDHLVFCGAIGIFLGRLGNFINGELYGRVSDVPWAMIFPEGGQLPRHPSQLYESFFEGFLMSIILFTVIKFQRRDGTALFCFFSLYSVFRFFIEFFRQPDSQLGFIVFGLSMGQLLCLGMLILTLGIWKYTFSKA